jgi:hypothetical protein
MVERNASTTLTSFVIKKAGSNVIVVTTVAYETIIFFHYFHCVHFLLILFSHFFVFFQYFLQEKFLCENGIIKK